MTHSGCLIEKAETSLLSKPSNGWTQASVPSKSIAYQTRLTILGKSIALNDPSSDADVPNFAPATTKRSKTSSTLSLNLSGSELAALPPEELISRVLELQEIVKEFQAQLDNEKTKVEKLQKTGVQTTLTPVAGNAAAQHWSVEKVAERADKLADQVAKAIKKQMKWQVGGLLYMIYRHEF